MTVAASRAMPDDDGRLGLAVTLAQEAGRHVMTWRADSAVAWKAPGERVWDADVRAQAEMVDAIRVRVPADGVIADEGERSTSAGDRVFVWVLDPLDGMNNYAIGILPVGAARYEAAPTPFLASNPSSHELAATACRAALAAQPVADRPSGDSPTAE